MLANLGLGSLHEVFTGNPLCGLAAAVVRPLRDRERSPVLDQAGEGGDAPEVDVISRDHILVADEEYWVQAAVGSWPGQQKAVLCHLQQIISLYTFQV